jgi:Domain amino terminal to FKBP-type peptidyl-prolyl isomerase
MKQTAIAVLMVVFLAAQATAGEGTVLKGQMEKESYATGVTLVRNLIQQGGSFDLDLVIKGMKDQVAGEKLLLTEEALRVTLIALKNELKKRQTHGVIEYPDQYKAIEKEDAPMTAASSPQEPAQVQTPVRDEEQALRALAIASIAPPKGSAQQTPALSPSSFQALSQSGAPVQEHTFDSLAAQQQQQTNDDGTVQIVLSSLTRRYAENWLKTQPHQQ